MDVLIVEDDKELQGQLERLLSNAGYNVQLAEDGPEALYYVREYNFDMAIIDLGLPKIDGLGVIQAIRDDEYAFPILILTARSNWKTKVQGLDAGADDYLTKPFQTEELLARVNALLRRAGGFSQQKISVGPLALDMKSAALYKQDQELDLTAFEYKLMEHFMMNPGKVASKAILLDRLYQGQDEDTSSNVLEVIIARLRKKLDPSGELKPIETLRGRGYRFFKPGS